MSSLSEIRDLFRGIFPFLISHHPICSKFDCDTYEVLGRRICLGCSTSYPLAALVVISDIVLRWDQWIATWFLHKEWLLFASIALGSLQALKYLYPPQTKALRIIVKVALGLSIAGMMVWLFTLPVVFPIQFALFFIFALTLGYLASHRYNYLRRICSRCVYHGDWDLCYGFRTINHHCRLGKRLSRPALRSHIFDKARKKRWAIEDKCRSPLDADEPVLDDAPPWVFHESAYDIFWLPRIGLEVEKRAEIPK